MGSTLITRIFFKRKPLKCEVHTVEFPQTTKKICMAQKNSG